MENLKGFYKNKKVFVTGHTGFKGSWLCNILLYFGASVSGYALYPQCSDNMFDICDLKNDIDSYIGDIRDYDRLKKIVSNVNPDIVIHLAAQPLVIESYLNPKETYEVNVIGTVNILECLRGSNVKSFLNITTDKVYKNKEWCWGYRENEELIGLDPYSNSKSCSELVTYSYKNSFFEDEYSSAISTARAGNVIGGGDFSKNRIIPDCIKSAISNKTIILRNPNSIRPYQHVLEPLIAYLILIREQYNDRKFSGCYNIGPNEEDCVTTGLLADIFCNNWGKIFEKPVNWIVETNDGPHEANFLKLDCSLFKNTFNWTSKWKIEKALEQTVSWTKSFYEMENMKEVTFKQIEEYFKN